ncbi:class I histocompatibility antigen, F10 alpha chain-like [Dromiciops gliroides]|uniref:class I histocompatibility antigen, F10 alpha chain-like n=1 Tax=Dromiciops gliroides TaxID=33562 RepID=UPI001CC33597|nr:class I histocompatibility antigen, F10 alpha chain-like [Dromiciops gliroides]
MEDQRLKGLLPSWLLLVSLFDMREAQETYHKHEILFTAVGTRRSLTELLITHVIDDVKVCSYDKHDGKLVFKYPWISKVLGTEYIKKKKKTITDIEMNFRSVVKHITLNDTKSHTNQTLQLFADCELDRDIQVGSHIQFALNGGLHGKIDDDDWVFFKPEAEQFKIFLQSGFQTALRRHYIQEHCYGMMRKILQYSNMKENVPPEVTIGRHEATDGRVTLSCTARGFFPPSILLHWEKDGWLGIWGQEISSGTLPNADNTFYLRVTMELQLEDTGAYYTCVVEHSELSIPAVYPVPRKPSKERPWDKVLGALAVVILVLSCVVAFIMWKKKTGKEAQFLNHIPGASNKCESGHPVYYFGG